ncbi:MAG: TadE/TadG family type IV pilus assembly protein [Methylocella sp.]
MEFALVGPPFLMLLVGIMYTSVVVFSAASMHYAVEGAARYYSVNVSSAAAAQSYAQSLYSGVSSPTFTASNPACGCQVEGALNVVLGMGMAQWNIPLSATACFPLTQ